ncbi:MAG: alpha/beta hydrolase [Clostridiales Family XIII bacterium]|jgi:pimeloyl-ACP methyl ester carboxylesterase|nr:alpha/beta hydrolase [Clostridiales Family XIII bacterium]
MASPFREIAGKSVHLIDMNPNGPRPLIMIHGLFTSLALWYHIIAPKLAEKRRVILYDLRGHGQSEATDGPFGLETLFGDLRELMAALELPRVSLAGYSFGGALALYAALTRPEMVERLALVDAPIFSERSFDRFAAPPSGEGGRMSEAQAEEAFRQSLADYGRSLRATVSGKAADGSRERFKWLFLEGGLEEAFRRGRVFFENAPFEEIKAPTLLLYGLRSPYRATGRLLAGRIPESSLKIAWADHNLPVTRAAWTGRHLCRFYRF